MIYSRFKQLKEQEARRRKQGEEEKRKAEEAAAEETQVTNGRHEIENGNGVELVVEKSKEHQSENAIHNSSNGVPVNGDPSRQEMKEDKNTTSVFQMADSEVSTHLEVDKGDAQQSYENVEKVSFIHAYACCYYRTVLKYLYGLHCYYWFYVKLLVIIYGGKEQRRARVIVTLPILSCRVQLSIQ